MKQMRYKESESVRAGDLCVPSALMGHLHQLDLGGSQHQVLCSLCLLGVGPEGDVAEY